VAIKDASSPQPLTIWLGSIAKRVSLLRSNRDTKAWDALQRSLPEGHPDIATALNNLGTFYFTVGRLREAGEFLERSLEIRRQALAQNHPDIALPDIAQSLNNLAALDRKLGNLAPATARLRKAVDIRLKVFGEMHPNVATALDNLAGVLKSAGQYEEAERLFRKALEIREGTLGPNHQDVALSLNNLTTAQISLGKLCCRQACESLGLWGISRSSTTKSAITKQQFRCLIALWRFATRSLAPTIPMWP
jgi:tetratricopeptide (TPR) repeat protein